MELTRAQRFWSKVERRGPDECWWWTASRNPRGYGYFWNADRDQMDLAHRAAYELTYGPLPRDTDIGARGTLVLHKCDEPGCVNPRHLFLGNQAANMLDMRTKGRSPNNKGTRNPRARLTDAEIEEIRNSYTGKHGDKMRIARQYRISSGYVSKIIAGQFRAA